LARSAVDDLRRRLGDEPSLPSLPSARAISWSRRSRSASRLARSAARGGGPAPASRRPPGIGTLAAASPSPTRAGPCRARSASRVASPDVGDLQAGLDRQRLAPAAQRPDRLDRTLHLVLGVRVDERSSTSGVRVAASIVSSISLPQLLGDERDHRVGERERLAQHVQERGLRVGVALVQPRLDELEVPVAQLAEDEVVEAEASLEKSNASIRAAASALARCRRERIQRSSTVVGRARPGRPRRG
jgi:hypothetical protein